VTSTATWKPSRPFWPRSSDGRSSTCCASATSSATAPIRWSAWTW
jgi:hypothetical protein